MNDDKKDIATKLGVDPEDLIWRDGKGDPSLPVGWDKVRPDDPAFIKMAVAFRHWGSPNPYDLTAFLFTEMPAQRLIGCDTRQGRKSGSRPRMGFVVRLQRGNRSRGYQSCTAPLRYIRPPCGHGRANKNQLQAAIEEAKALKK